jgi:hypothetical protein
MATQAHREQAASLAFPPLDQITRPTVDTAAAAYYLNRKPQTLREWAMTGKVIQPHRVNGRLAWPVAAIRAVLGVQA